MKLLSPEQQLKEKRPGMPENKPETDSWTTDKRYTPDTIWTRAEPLNYPRVISLQKTSSHWLPLEQTKNQVRKEVKVKQACFKG